jgi:molybdopterin molybdotransferase
VGHPSSYSNRGNSWEQDAGSETQALPFFALAGNPVSSALTFLLFVAPLLAALAGGSGGPRIVMARLAHATEKHGKAGWTRFLPARCDFGATDGQFPTVELVATHGSGDLLSLAHSNCFLVAPAEGEHFAAGAIVRILLS